MTAHRDKYYRFDKFPNGLSYRSSFYYILRDVSEKVHDYALIESFHTARERIVKWFQSNNYSESDYSISKKMTPTTETPEDIADGELKAVATITITNKDKFLNEVGLDKAIIDSIVGSIRLKSGNYFEVIFKSSLSKLQVEEVIIAIENYIDKPVIVELYENFEKTYIENVSKVFKKEFSQNIIDSGIIKLPVRGKIEIISPNSEEYENYLASIESVKLNRDFKKELTNNTPTKKKLKL